MCRPWCMKVRRQMLLPWHWLLRYAQHIAAACHRRDCMAFEASWVDGPSVVVVGVVRSWEEVGSA
jgi:hypothetical protein